MGGGGHQPKIAGLMRRNWLVGRRREQGCSCIVGVCTPETNESATQQEPKDEGRTVHKNGVAPPIDRKAAFGQLEGKENGNQREHGACSSIST